MGEERTEGGAEVCTLIMSHSMNYLGPAIFCFSMMSWAPGNLEMQQSMGPVYTCYCNSVLD